MRWPVTPFRLYEGAAAWFVMRPRLLGTVSLPQTAFTWPARSPPITSSNGVFGTTDSRLDISVTADVRHQRSELISIERADSHQRIGDLLD